jgi:hypothetical protein
MQTKFRQRSITGECTSEWTASRRASTSRRALGVAAPHEIVVVSLGVAARQLFALSQDLPRPACRLERGMQINRDGGRCRRRSIPRRRLRLVDPDSQFVVRMQRRQIDPWVPTAQLRVRD